MKLRTGFVSNSSSSSFVVAFKKKPQEHELLDILFPFSKEGGRPGVSSPWNYDDEASVGVDAVTTKTIIWEQLKDQKPLTKKQILEEIRSGWFEGHPDSSDRYHTEYEIAREYTEKTGKNIYDKDADPVWKKKHNEAWKADSDAYRKDIDKAAKDLFDRVYENKFKGKKCFRFSFSDNDGHVFSVLEHGDTFRNCPHIRISHH